MELFRLFGSIFVNSDEANDGIAAVDDNAQRTGKSLGSMIGTAAKWGAGIALGVGGAVTGLMGLASAASDTASDIADMSVRTGLSTTRLQELKFASEQAGVNFESMTSAVAKLTKTMGSAEGGGKKAQQAFAELGVSTTDATGSLRSIDDIFPEVLQSLGNMTNETERNAMATKLFGGSATELVPLLAQGGEGIAALSQQAHDLGLVLSEDTIAAGDTFGDSLDMIKGAIGGVGTAIGAELMPKFQVLFDWVLEKMPQIQAGIGTAFDAVTVGVTWLSDNALPPLVAGFDLLRDAVGFVTDNMDIFLPIILGVTAAIVAQMAINALTKAYKAWQAITVTQTAMQWLLNVALNANPLGVVALAVGVLVAAGVLLYKNWDTVKLKAGELWTSMKEIFGNIKTFVTGVWDDVMDGITGAINGIIRAINKLIGGLNKIQVNVPGWVEDTTGMGDFGINIPLIPMLAKGTKNFGGGLAIVGEQGPELVSMPRGSQVTPNRETEALINGSKQPEYIQSHIYLDGKKIGESVSKSQYNKTQSNTRSAGLAL